MFGNREVESLDEITSQQEQQLPSTRQCWTTGTKYFWIELGFDDRR